jgi:hypothetical protein
MASLPTCAAATGPPSGMQLQSLEMLAYLWYDGPLWSTLMFR